MKFFQIVSHCLIACEKFEILGVGNNKFSHRKMLHLLLYMVLCLEKKILTRENFLVERAGGVGTCTPTVNQSKMRK